jgi:hypothetical protein
MPKFALKKIEAVVGKQQFFELLVDDVSQYKQFMAEISDNPQYVSEVKTILTYMNLVAELRVFLPKTKFRDITPSKDKIKEYEFKSDHLRVYAFHLEMTGKIVAYWGYKNNQDKDIKKFRSIKKLFIETQKI